MCFLQGVYFHMQLPPFLLNKSCFLCKKKYHCLKRFQFDYTERCFQCGLHFLKSLQYHLDLFEWILIALMVYQSQFGMSQSFLLVDFPCQLVPFLHQFEQYNRSVFFVKLASCTKRLLVQHFQLKVFTYIYQVTHSEEKKKMYVVTKLIFNSNT